MAGSFVLRRRTAVSADLPRHASSSVEGVHRQHLPRFYQSWGDRDGVQGCAPIGRRKRDRKEKCVCVPIFFIVCLLDSLHTSQQPITHKPTAARRVKMIRSQARDPFVAGT